MDATTARKILGVAPDATLDHINSRYKYLAKKFHPDVPITGDKESFIQINLAYTVLRGVDLSIKIDQGSLDNIDYSLHLSAEINHHIDEALSYFETKISALCDRIDRRVHDLIMSTKSPSQLQEILKDDVSKLELDANAEIRTYIKEVTGKISKEGSDLLFNLFKEQYANRRKYWIRNLLYNKIVITEFISQVLVLIARATPYAHQIPIIEILTYSYVQIVILGIGAVLLLIEYSFLDPRIQFIPPGLSINQIHSDITKVAGSVSGTPGEGALGGAVLGGVGASLLIPEPVTMLVVAILGAIFGSMTGKELIESQNEAYSAFITKFRYEITDLIRKVKEWTYRYRVELKGVIRDGFLINCRKILQLNREQKLPIKFITHKE